MILSLASLACCSSFHLVSTVAASISILGVEGESSFGP